VAVQRRLRTVECSRGAVTRRKSADKRTAIPEGTSDPVALVPRLVSSISAFITFLSLGIQQLRSRGVVGNETRVGSDSVVSHRVGNNSIVEVYIAESRRRALRRLPPACEFVRCHSSSSSRFIR
jgi:hypothetical protein